MISSAYVRVSCNKCWSEEEIELTPTARRGWDERNVGGALSYMGWREVDDNTHYCEDCAAEIDEEERRKDADAQPYC